MRKPRHAKSTGASSYQAYLKQVRIATTASAAPSQVVTKVFAATCSSSRRLGDEIGLPIAYIGVSTDPCLLVAGLSNVRHGSLVPSGTREGFRTEDDWDLWKLLRLIPDMVGATDLGMGIRLDRGVLNVHYDAMIPHAELQMTLAASLRHLRFHDVASDDDAVLARASRGGPSLVVPRYTPTSVRSSISYQRVDDIYVFNPWQDLRKLTLIIEATLLRLIDRYGPIS